MYTYVMLCVVPNLSVEMEIYYRIVESRCALQGLAKIQSINRVLAGIQPIKFKPKRLHRH